VFFLHSGVSFWEKGRGEEGKRCNPPSAPYKVTCSGSWKKGGKGKKIIIISRRRKSLIDAWKGRAVSMDAKGRLLTAKETICHSRSGRSLKFSQEGKSGVVV